MKAKNIIPFLLPFTLLFNSCGKSASKNSNSSESNSNPNEQFKLVNAIHNFTQIKGMYLDENKDLPDKKAIYTLNADNSISELGIFEITDVKTGKKITKSSHVLYSPRYIFDTKYYVLLYFENSHYMIKRCPFITIRKSDAHLACLETKEDFFVYEDAVNFNSEKTFIVFRDSDILYKLDLSTDQFEKNSLKRIIEKTSKESVFKFQPNSLGDIITYSRSGGGDLDLVKIINHNDKIQPLNPNLHGYEYLDGSSGFGQNFYFLKYYNNFGKVHCKLESLEKFGDSFNHKIIHSTLPEVNKLVKTNRSMFAYNEEILIDAMNSSNSQILKPVQITKIAQIQGSHHALFILGTNTSGQTLIEKYDINSKTFTTLIQPDKFSITYMNVNDNGDLNFIANRYADNVQIFALLKDGKNENDLLIQKVTSKEKISFVSLN
ncbi:hypothetical protein [Pigmentibacter ruber]|uniref:hypothetical protein n=1 Tax=Pigmentibacter ruber TaxID=2683196 RepID=UPI00131B27BE|nr:hypothetical protein [Pigmentibacter ruber]